MPSYSFDADEHESSEFGLIETGWYPARIVDSDIKHTRRGDGRYVELVFQLQDERNRGRKLWSTYMVDHPKETVVRIGKQQLARVSQCAGVAQWTATEQLHGTLVGVEIGLEPASNGYAARNKITGYQTAHDLQAAEVVERQFNDDDIPF